MSHNSRLRAPTFWVLDSPVTPAEFEAFDLAQFEAINGDQGGTWAPAAAIVIGGAGLQVTGSSQLSDCQNLTVTTGGSLTVDAGASMTIDGTATIGVGPVDFQSTDVTFDAGSVVAFDGTVTVSGTISVGGDLSVSGGSLSIDGASTATLASGAVLTASSGAQCDVALGAVLDVEGTLRVDGQVRVQLSNSANTSFTTTNDQPSYVVQVNDGSVHNITCHVATTPPDNGQLMFLRIDLTGAGSGVNVGNEGGAAGGIAVFGTGTGRGGLILQWNNTANTWRVLSGWGTNLAYGASA